MEQPGSVHMVTGARKCEKTNTFVNDKTTSVCSFVVPHITVNRGYGSFMVAPVNHCQNILFLLL